MPLVRQCSGTPAKDGAGTTRQTLAATLRNGATQAERRHAASDLASAFRANQELIAALPGEPDPGVRAAILAALVSIGTERVASGLAGMVQSEDAQLRNAAIEALRQLGALALPYAEQLMECPCPEQRIQAIALLESQSDHRAKSLLRKALEHDPEINVGLAAVEALSLIGGPDAEEPLRRFAARFPDNEFAHFAVSLACRRIAAGAAA